jgi:N utilization substance protein B
MGTRRKAREFALQVLYQIDLTGMEVDAALELFCKHFEAGKKSMPYARRLVQGSADKRQEIDAMISSHAENWRPERMSVIDRNILRLALYEMCFEEEVPARVVINEAIEVAKRFGNDDSGPFINGILDSIRKTIGAGQVLPSEKEGSNPE